MSEYKREKCIIHDDISISTLQALIINVCCAQFTKNDEVTILVQHDIIIIFIAFYDLWVPKIMDIYPQVHYYKKFF